MAACSNNTHGLTERELEMEALRLIKNGPDSNSGFLDQVTEYSGHQTDSEEMNDNGKESCYKTKSSNETSDQGNYYSTLENSSTLKTGTSRLCHFFATIRHQDE